VVHLSDIPENTYQKTVKEESSLYTPKGLVDIWRDMCAIREFETVLNELKLREATGMSLTIMLALLTCP